MDILRQNPRPDLFYTEGRRDSWPPDGTAHQPSPLIPLRRGVGITRGDLAEAYSLKVIELCEYRARLGFGPGKCKCGNCERNTFGKRPGDIVMRAND